MSSIPSELLRFCFQCEKALKQAHNKFIIEGQVSQTWKTLLRAYSKNDKHREVIAVFKGVFYDLGINPRDSFTYTFLLKACGNLEAVKTGKEIHGQILKSGLLGIRPQVHVHTAMVGMYSACGCLNYAKNIFDEMPARNTVSWNALITGLVKWSKLDVAIDIFDMMPARNVVSWSAMIDGFARANRPLEAIRLFQKMLSCGLKPNEITMLSVVPSLGNYGAIELGRQFHAIIVKKDYSFDVRICNVLVDMYSRCGCVDEAWQVFRAIVGKTVISYTVMISGFAMHGLAYKAIEQIEVMKEENVRPNRVTFLSILNACSHAGLVEHGRRYFLEMVRDFGIIPDVKHCGCVIDLLGRAGLLEEAERLIEDLPLKANVIVWRTLLGACGVHGDPMLGRKILERITAVERGYGGDYVMLSNMYSAVGKWDEASRVRRLVDEEGAIKLPGRSLVD